MPLLAFETRGTSFISGLISGAAGFTTYLCGVSWYSSGRK